ncbi:MAG: hypothetical protein AAFX79_07435 [Planctomycetota bacterium]
MTQLRRRWRADQRTALIAVNAALVLVLGVVALSPVADAQQRQRPRGEYLIVGGQVIGAPTNAVHVVDVTNQELVSLRWDQSRQSFMGIGYRNLADDARSDERGDGGR